MDGVAVTPLSLPYDPATSHNYCPTCSPYYLRGVDETRNGGERLSYMPAHYENHGATALGLAAMYGPVLSQRSTPDFYTNTRAISTDVWPSQTGGGPRDRFPTVDQASTRPSVEHPGGPVLSTEPEGQKTYGMAF